MSIKVQNSCSLCSSDCIYLACICNREVKALCKSCIADHISDLSSSHELIEFDIASKIISDPAFLEEYYQDITTVFEITNSLNLHSTKLSRFRKTISDCKKDLTSQIDSIFNQLLNKVEDIQFEVKKQNELMSRFRRTQCEEGKSLIERFREKGDRELYSEFIERIEIPVEDIMKIVNEKIVVQYSDFSQDIRKKSKLSEDTASNNIQLESMELDEHPLSSAQKEFQDKLLSLKSQIDSLLTSQFPNQPSSSRYPDSISNNSIITINSDTSDEDLIIIPSEAPNRYIYIPKLFTKTLLKFDIVSKELESIFLPTINRNFEETGTCVLPNGSVVIAGFSNPVSNEVYLYNPNTSICDSLANLSIARYFISLYYYDGFVYAFGGKDDEDNWVMKCERLNLEENRWEMLPELMHSEDIVSCVGVDKNIYLFCGSNRMIDIFNIETLRFDEMKIENSETVDCCGLSYLFKDRIYLITHSYIQVYDLTLSKLQQYTNSSQHHRYTTTNTILHNNSFHFYNFNLESIQKERIPLLGQTPRCIKYDTKNFASRYIYRQNTNTSILLRLDLHSETIEAIDLSSTLTQEFSGTSVCMLPSGEVFIAGFRDPVTGACYIYNPITQDCRRLRDMQIPRYFICLVYHNNFVYSFGGEIENGEITTDAERFDIEKGKWMGIAKMIKARNSASCVGIENRIFIFGGGKDSVEVYDIKKNYYNLIKMNLYVDCVAVKICDLIYVIGDGFKILNKDFKILHEIEHKQKENSTYSIGNVGVYKGCVYFYNQDLRLYERFYALAGERTIVAINHN